jgi:hypothetical protein
MLTSAKVAAAFSALSRGPSTTFGGPPPHRFAIGRMKSAAVFISPIAKRWGSTPEGGEGVCKRHSRAERAPVGHQGAIKK